MKIPFRDEDALEVRRTGAANRAAYYATLTPQQKLERLDARLGPGNGAAKERAKLASEITGRASEKKPKKK
jgi:hypothetical protein